MVRVMKRMAHCYVYVIAAADIYEVCGRMASVEDWRDWRLADLLSFTSAIAGVSSVQVAGNEAAATAYGNVQDMVDEMVREVGLSEVFDPPTCYSTTPA